MSGVRNVVKLWAVPLVLTLSLVPLSACDDDPVEVEPQVHTIRLTIGTQTVNLVQGNPGTITLARGANSVSATFLKADGTVETLVNANDQELRFENIANASILTFTRTGAFSGTFNGLAAGSTTMRVCLFHIEEAHCDFEIATQAVTVN